MGEGRKIVSKQVGREHPHLLIERGSRNIDSTTGAPEWLQQWICVQIENELQVYGRSLHREGERGKAKTLYKNIVN